MRFLTAIAFFFCGTVQYAAPVDEVCIGNCINGKGKKTLTKSFVYEGTFQGGKFHGTGDLKALNNKGVSYFGDWFEGLRHGKGTQIYPTKGRYIGSWRNDKRDGYGDFTSSLEHCDLQASDALNDPAPLADPLFNLPLDYCTYSGEWKENLPAGYGKFLIRFDTIRLLSERFYRITKESRFIPIIARLKHYERLPAQIELIGIWSQGIPQKCRVTVTDKNSKTIYSENIDFFKELGKNK